MEYRDLWERLRKDRNTQIKVGLVVGAVALGIVTGAVVDGFVGTGSESASVQTGPGYCDPMVQIPELCK